MEDIYDVILVNIDIFFLVLVRTTGIFIVSPIFGRNNLPMMMKIALSVLVALILLPVISITDQIQYTNLIGLAFSATKEFLLGIIIGFIGFMYFSFLYLAGTMIDTQVGFSMVNVLDPQMRTQVPIMGNYYNIIFTLIFLIFNGHHFVLQALAYSYEVLPIGSNYTIGEDIVYNLVVIMGEIFVLAFKFSAPVLITIFLANILLGILARTMPQMNIFVVGLPLKIVIGLLTIMITLQFIIPFSEVLFDKISTSTYKIIQLLSKG